MSNRFVVLAALTSILCLQPRAGIADSVDIELAKLERRLHTDSLKQAVTQHGRILKGADPISKRKSLLFFADLQAKDLLLACLVSDDPALAGYTATECLGVFGVSELPVLYKVAADLCPGTLMTGGDNIVARNAIVQRLALRTSEILKIPHVWVKEYTPETVRDWWTNALNTAKSKGYVSDVDAALRLIAKQK